MKKKEANFSIVTDGPGGSRAAGWGLSDALGFGFNDSYVYEGENEYLQDFEEKEKQKGPGGRGAMDESRAAMIKD